MSEPERYDRGQFYRILAEVQGYFAELRYIDTAMALMEAEKASWWERMPGGNGTSMIIVMYGATFPFEKAYHVPEHSVLAFWKDSREAEVEEELRVLAAEAESWAATEIESIVRRVEPFTWPEGSVYEGECIEPVMTAHNTLEDRVSTDFGELSHSLENWEGDAADNFGSKFYNVFGDVLHSQKQLLLALAGGVATAKAIAEVTQYSLMNVVRNTREALREQLELAAVTAELDRQATIRNCLIIAGGTATLFTGLTSKEFMSLVPRTVSGITSISSAAVPADALTDYVLRGTTAEELLNAMSDAVSQIDMSDNDQHKKLMEVVRGALARFEALRRSDGGGGLVPIQPDIVHGVDGRDFYLP